MRIIYLILLLLISYPCWAACPDNNAGPSGADVCYISPTGTGSACTSGSPCSITEGVEVQAVSGNYVYFAAGDYGVSSTLDVPAGVSLYNPTGDYNDVSIRPIASFPENTTSGYMIRIDGGTPGTSGNQEMYAIDVNGTYLSYYGWRGILVEDMDSVSITYCRIIDFNHHNPGETSQSQGMGSLGILVQSTSLPHSSSWGYFFDPPWQRDTNWSGATPISGFVFNHNYIKDCGNGWEETGYRSFTPSMMTYLVDSFEVSYNIFDNQTYVTQDWWNTVAALSNGSIHHNVFLGNDNGRFSYNQSCFRVELWGLYNVLFYNNTMINGGISIIGALNGSRLYNNKVDVWDVTHNNGPLMEVSQWDGSVDHNFIISNNETGGHNYGFTIGWEVGGEPNAYGGTTYLHNNLVVGTTGKGVECSVSNYRGYEAFTNANIWNNIFANCSHGGAGAYEYPTIHIRELYTSALMHAEIWNNIFLNGATAISTVDANGDIEAGDVILRNNIFYGNTAQTAGSGITNNNPITSEPTFTDYVKATKHLDFTVLNGSSPQVDAGYSIVSPYTLALNPAVDWFPSPNTTPLNITYLDQDLYGGGVEIGAYPYTSGSDTTAPTVVSASINGAVAVINCSEDVVTTGLDNGDLAMTGSTTGAVDLESCSEIAGVISCTAAMNFVNGETVTLAYTGGVDEVEDTSGNDMATFSGFSVTNTTAIPQPHPVTIKAGTHVVCGAGSVITIGGYTTAPSEILMDSYVESNYSKAYALYSGYLIARGQSITGDGNKFNKATFYLRKVGSPTGNAVAKLYTHSGTFGTSSIPTGSALVTSNSFDVSTLDTSMSLQNFDFSVPYTTTESVYYVLTIEYDGGDINNSVEVGHDNTSSTHGGNRCYSADGASWTYNTGDMIFYAYGQ